ncbi:MAG TPA: hypothetical protein VFX53_04565 [Pedococcus sp.]|nr:hypothetical protein [Pedococcus sp.]
MTGLFPAPDPDIPALSVALGGPAWRLPRGGKAKWVRLSVKTIDCQECSHLQHETRGDFGPRRQAKRRRRYDGTQLDLCRAHAQAWQERDAEDSGVPA